MFILLTALSVNFELSHPFIWFNLFFTFYSLSTPILHLLGEYNFYKTYAHNFNYIQIVYAEYLAVLAFSLAIFPKVIPYNLSAYRNYNYIEALFKGKYYIISLSILLSFINLYGIIKSDIHDKIIKIVEFSPMLVMDFPWKFMIVAIVTIILYFRLKNKIFPFALLILLSIYMGLVLFICGERGPLFSFSLAVLMSYHIIYHKLKFIYFFIVLLVGLYSSTFFGVFKMSLLGDTTLAETFALLPYNYTDIIPMMIGGEFRSASENLGVALQAVPSEVPFLYGKSLVMDLVRAVVPGFLFPRGTFPSTVDWFNETFFSEFYATGAGVGFSLVGTGYVNFGYPGIVGLFFILGWIVKKISEKSVSSPIFLIFYVNFIPLLCYAIRGDIATIISQSWKHILLPIWIMIFIGKLIGTAKPSFLRKTSFLDNIIRNKVLVRKIASKYVAR